MSEERMERKCVSRSQQPKAGSSDCKKSSDAAHKPWPRSGKKREGGNSSSRNEAGRRNVPPARGAVAGRARLHGQRPLGRDESSRLEDTEAELGSVFSPGSKKQSLNHLLQFVYSPRDRAPMRPVLARARRSAPHPHHTELFLQASCQFVVREEGDYSAHLCDPDLPVDWDLVQHVVVRGHSSECAVCLCAPVAARVTRCGHVYCWPCMLHYTHVHPLPAPPCPVCTAPLDVARLKSASLRSNNTPVEGEEIDMRLVRRARNSTLVEPVPAVAAAHHSPRYPRWQHHADLLYANILTITTQQVNDIIQRERAELSQQILDEIDTSELPYLEQALDLLKQKETELASAQTPVSLARAPSRSPSPPLVREPASVASRVDWFDVTDGEPELVADIDEDVDKFDDTEEDADSAVGYVSVVGEEVGERAPQGLDPEAPEFVTEELVVEAGGGDEPPVMSDRDKESQAKYFYFYQGAGGEQVFLHGLNVRLLTASWGGLAAAPLRLRATLLSVRQLTVTAQSRLHTPCTAHLPLHCPYELVELHLRPPDVTPRALALYAGELEQRARQRSRALRDERRRDRRAIAHRPAPPSHASLHHFPRPHHDTPSSPPQPPSPPPPPLELARDARAPLSFAKMAGASGAWRVRSPPAAAPSAAPSVATTVTASDEDEPPPPPRALRLSDAIEAALHAPPAPQKHKQKKNKQRLLFTTNVPRAQ